MTTSFIRQPTFFEAYDSCPLALAFRELLPELHALAESDLQLVNLDVPKAIALSFSVIDRLGPLARIPGIAPGLEPQQLARLSLTTRALAHTHRQLIGTLRVTESPSPQLVARANCLKARMEAEVDRLVARRIIRRRASRRKCRRPGLRALAAELSELATTLQEPRALGNHSLSSAELRLAVALATSMRSPTPAVRSRPNDFPIHRGTFTLFWHAYGSVRQSVIHLQDPDSLAPTLYGPRRGTTR